MGPMGPLARTPCASPSRPPSWTERARSCHELSSSPSVNLGPAGGPRPATDERGVLSAAAAAAAAGPQREPAARRPHFSPMGRLGPRNPCAARRWGLAFSPQQATPPRPPRRPPQGAEPAGPAGLLQERTWPALAHVAPDRLQHRMRWIARTELTQLPPLAPSGGTRRRGPVAAPVARSRPQQPRPARRVERTAATRPAVRRAGQRPRPVRPAGPARPATPGATGGEATHGSR